MTCISSLADIAKTYASYKKADTALASSLHSICPRHKDCKYILYICLTEITIHKTYSTYQLHSTTGQLLCSFHCGTGLR